ncbi:hypothetical protein N9N28_12290 [Rubripirellula amarantea]|nr:hypothetical protein [Rubripirellula amarantea]
MQRSTPLIHTPSKAVNLALGLVIGALSLSSTGCFWGLQTLGPSLGMASIPIPISPYLQKKKEDEFWRKERYDRVPILGPITSGSDPVAIDPPSDDEVMVAMEKANPVQGNWPLLYERNRNNVRIVKQKIADYVDPPRHYPMIGPAQQHHAHYKCTVYYTDVRNVGWPVCHRLVDEDAREVLYIDHNHLHMVGNVDDGGVPQF